MPEKFSFEQPKEKPKRELPVGEARSIAEQVNKRWRERLVLLSQVRNRVLDVNEEVDFPLRLEKNKQSPLGLFIEATLSEEPEETPPKKKLGEFWPEHGRSVSLGRMLFSDKEGRIWRDIDLKGIGHMELWCGEKGYFVDIRPLGLKGHHAGTTPEAGLLHRDTAFVDWDLSEQFLKAGIRTHRVLAVIQLNELIDKGEKISLAKARERGIIDDNFHPVVEARAFATKARLMDIAEETDMAKVLLMDAKKLVAQEQGRKEALTTEEYLAWFAKTLGENVALMHKNGWKHDYLNRHNITLDCRIVDLDSVKNLSEDFDKEYHVGDVGGADLFNAINNMAWLFKKLYKLEGGEPTENLAYYQNLVVKNYNAIFTPKEREQYFQKLQKERKKSSR